jgi:hypothetical protein
MEAELSTEIASLGNAVKMGIYALPFGKVGEDETFASNGFVSLND